MHHAQYVEHAIGVAVRGDKADAGGDGRLALPRGNSVAADMNAARQRPDAARDRAGDLVGAAADDPGKPDDLAARHRELDWLRFRAHPQSRDLRDDLAGVRGYPGNRLNVLADHRQDDLRRGKLRGRSACDSAVPVTNDGDPVGNRNDFIELVADEEDRGSLTAKCVDGGEQHFGLGMGKRGGRFIEHKNPGILRARAGDF